MWDLSIISPNVGNNYEKIASFKIALSVFLEVSIGNVHWRLVILLFANSIVYHMSLFTE